MKTHNDYEQQKVTGGAQKVILNERETAETDELDPKFEDQQDSPGERYNLQTPVEKSTDVSGQKP